MTTLCLFTVALTLVSLSTFALTVIPEGHLETRSTKHVSLSLQNRSAAFQWTEAARAAAVPKFKKLIFSESATASTTSLESNSTLFGTMASEENKMEWWCDEAQKTEPSSYPAYNVGRLYCIDTTGKSGFSCTGAFIDNGGLVLTAGHCCYNPDNSGTKEEPSGWFSSCELVLNYNHGGGKAYQVDSIHVPTSYTKTGDSEHDYCFLSMKDKTDSYLGWSYGFKPAARMAHVRAYGYPWNYGKTQEMHSQTGFYASRTGGDDAGTVDVNCVNMHHGSSGGPWIDTNGHVVGLTSNHYHGDQLETSPYFGKDWFDSCQFAGGCKTRRLESTSEGPLLV